MTEKIIVHKPETCCGVYAVINPIQKRAYIGESMNLYRRFCEHIRSMLELEESSNHGLMDEIKNVNIPVTYEIFQLLFTNYPDKKNTCNTADRQWLKDETIYMYLFRKYGFSLYNEQTDNTGKKRLFLYDDFSSPEQTHKELLNYLESQNGNCEGYGYDSWEDFIQAADRELDEDFKKYFQKSINDFMKNPEPQKIWEKRISSENTSANIYYINPLNKKGYKNCYNELSKAWITKRDLQYIDEINIQGKTAQDLIKFVQDGLLDRIAICKFGHYLSQSPMTILQTKCFDIKNNILNYRNEEKHEINITSTGDSNLSGPGVCFWAFSATDTKTYSDFLSGDSSYQGPRYVIMPYTPSPVYAKSAKDDVYTQSREEDWDNRANKTLDDFFKDMTECFKKSHGKVQNAASFEELIKNDNFAFGYGYDRGAINKKEAKEYPNNMFPEIVSKRSKQLKNKSNNAFLISEISYIDAKINDILELSDFFITHTGKNLRTTLRGQNSRCCAKLIDEKKQAFINFLNDHSRPLQKDSEENPHINFIIARLEYPYVIALANNLDEIAKQK